MRKQDQLIFAIDGGGTSCRAVLSRANGERLAEGRSGPANIMTNFDLARANIIDACLNARSEAGLEDCQLSDSVAFLGVAGANIGTYAKDIISALPFTRCEVGTDAEIALQGAIGDKDGVVAIIGTGSVFISRKQSEVKTVGGWGFVVGDLGSGARIGRELLQEALLAHDGIRPPTPITSHVLTDFRNNPQTLVEYAHSASPRDFGKFAPLVLEYLGKDDETANRIWTRAADGVVETLEATIGDNPTRLCFLGGLGEFHSRHLPARFTEMLVPAAGNALDGALDLALRKFKERETQ